MRSYLEKHTKMHFWLPILVLLGLLLIFFWKLAFSNLILARGDTFLYFYPYWEAAAQALRTGRIPLWNPDIFMGAPLLANSQMGFFYPLNWPVWLLLSTPHAVKATILVHLFIAGLGTYVASQKIMGVGPAASLVAAISFSLGGYFSAQLEHINQIQGLAWLPWFLVGLSLAESQSNFRRLLSMLVLTVLFCLQLLSGHTQTAFITVVGLMVWQLSRLFGQVRISHQQNDNSVGKKTFAVEPFILLIGAVLLASLISAVQLIPTFELSQLSARQGGLAVNEVLSFSLHPLLFSRSLLPVVNQSLFSEYVAFLPIMFLSLAFIGACQWRKIQNVFPALIWLILGLFFAFGVFNPINWLLARLPLFNLFRAPARWMILYALGASLLIGVGFQLIINLVRTKEKNDIQFSQQLGNISRPLKLFLAGALLLFIWDYLGQFLEPFIPTGPEAPYEPPTLWTMVLRLFEWFNLAIFLLMFTKNKFIRMWRWVPVVWAAIGIFSLFISSRALPYNSLTTPEAFFDLRPSVSRLLAESRNGQNRFLSLSDIFFDAGDQEEIDAIYDKQLPAQAQYDYTIAIKQKEIIAPNLSMIYGLPSVDGFDGGILPTQIFNMGTSLILGDGVESTDGRLREKLDSIPENKWLDLFNTEFVITDKVGDQWINGLFFDRQHATQLMSGEALSVGYIPDYEASGIQVLASDLPGPLTAVTIDGQEWSLPFEMVEDELFVVNFPKPAKFKDLKIDFCPDVNICQIEALTLFDNRDQTFQSLVPGDYQLIHSGDVKIYRNLDVLPRSFMIYNWQWASNLDEAVAQMDSPDFDPTVTTVLIDNKVFNKKPNPIHTNNVYNQVEIVEYNPERVVLNVETAQEGYLILTDSFYPSWRASINGVETQIVQADGLFRGIFLPEGRHNVVFYLVSESYNTGRAISIAALLTATLLLVFLMRYKRK